MSGNDFQSSRAGEMAQHFFQRTQVQFSAPLLDSSQLPGSPAPGDWLSLSGLHKSLHSHGHIHTIQSYKGVGGGENYGGDCSGDRMLAT